MTLQQSAVLQRKAINCQRKCLANDFYARAGQQTTDDTHMQGKRNRDSDTDDESFVANV